MSTYPVLLIFISLFSISKHNKISLRTEFAAQRRFLFLICLGIVHRVIEPNITITTSKEDNANLKLLCWLDRFFPDKLKVEWLSGDTQIRENIQFFKKQDEKDKSFTALSQILIKTQEWNQGKEITCKATHNSKTIKATTSMVKACFKSEPHMRIEKPRLRSVMTEKQATASCIVESAYKVKVSWLVDGNKEQETNAEKGEDQTISNLTLPAQRWKTIRKITCRAEHPCFSDPEKTILITVPVEKTPTVVIRRILDSAINRDSLTLECAARDLPSGELAISVAFQNDVNQIIDTQFVDLPKDLYTLTALFTVDEKYHTKGQRFICVIESLTTSWKSNCTGKLFDDPSVELIAVSNQNKHKATHQKLICSVTGFNPKIVWLPENTASFTKTSNVLMQVDGRLKVSSEMSVPLVNWNNGVNFACNVSNHDLQGVQTSICDVTLASDLVVQMYLLKPSLKDLRSNKQVSVTCLLFGRKLKDFSITWKVGKDVSIQSVTTQSPVVHDNGTESVRSVNKIPVAKWNAYTNVFCEVKHRCADNSQNQVIFKTKVLKRPTIQILRPSDSDLSGTQSMTFLCLISGFHPADISVQWELNESPLDDSDFVNSPVGSTDGHDFFLHSALVLPVTGSESGTYSCVVHHESSEKPLKSTISDVYASMVQTSPSVVLLQGQGELVCLVSGYSPCVIDITWFLDGMIVPDNHNTTSPAKGPDGKFTVKSHLYVLAFEWAPGSTYMCKVKHVTGTVTRNITKPEFIEQSIYFDENRSDATAQDQVEETWKMACSFIALFVISLIYGCAATLIKIKAV